MRITVANSPTSRSGSQLSTSSASDCASSNCAIASAPPEASRPCQRNPVSEVRSLCPSSASALARTTVRIAAVSIASSFNAASRPRFMLFTVSSRLPYQRSLLLQHLTHRSNRPVHPFTLLQTLANRLTHRIRLSDQLSHRQTALQDRQRLAKTMQGHIDPFEQVRSTLLFHSLMHQQMPRSRDSYSPAPPSCSRSPSCIPRPVPSQLPGIPGPRPHSPHPASSAGNSHTHRLHWCPHPETSAIPPAATRSGCRTAPVSATRTQATQT